ncbi:MAG TPA: hypothetical protein VFD85_06295, partial [Gemmatimonadales bacterium]|nr:hypothetical protein [Gemmatimonadales bacterium]
MRSLLAFLVLSAGGRLAAQRPDSGAMNMPGMGPAMPIPMPPGMVMMPGLVGLTPPVTAFRPGGGIDMAALPDAKPMAPVMLKAGDTLDLTAMLVRRTIRGRAFVGYGFNG